MAWILCQCFWNAGVSKRVLQFVPCSGGAAGKKLVGHPDVNFVILTGGTETGPVRPKNEDAFRVVPELGIAVVSTNQGVLSDRECRERRVGGEVLCTVD